MDTAIAFNTVTKKQKRITAAVFEKSLAADPDYAKDLKLYEPRTRLKVPVHFRPSHKGVGDTQDIAAHFSRAAGHGPKDHVLPRERISHAEAVKQGQAILLSLNIKLTPRDFDFGGMLGEHVQTRREFREKMEGRYISLSARSVEEAAKRLAIIRPEDRKDRVYILYQGAVLPYDQFFVSSKDTVKLYRELASMKVGAPKGETRIIGLPRLVQLIPTKTMIDEKGSEGLKGNAMRERGLIYFNQLIVDNRKEKSEAYEALKKQILTSDEHGRYNGVYVLACPTITVGRKSDSLSRYRQIRWIINDIEAQTLPAVPLSSHRPSSCLKSLAAASYPASP